MVLDMDNPLEHKIRGVPPDPVDIFISYRRQGGATAARFLADRLRDNGFSVFLDTKSIGRGDFEQPIAENIKAAGNFLLIVSEKVFESENVCNEVRLAIELCKENSDYEILPVFINGLTDFPTMPLGFDKDIAYKNAFFLNHDTFDTELTKLIENLNTRHKEFVDKWMEFSLKTYSDPLMDVLNDLCVIFPEEKSAVLEFLSRKYRQSWTRNRRRQKKVIEHFQQTVLIKDLKIFLKKLGIEHRGSASLIRRNIEHWLNNKNSVLPEDIPKTQKDRFEVLFEAVSGVLFNDTKTGGLPKLKQHLRKLCEQQNTHDASVVNNNVDSLVNSLFWNSHGDIASLLDSLNLSEQLVKQIAQKILNTEKGRKKELIERLQEWVDYKIEAEKSNE